MSQLTLLAIPFDLASAKRAVGSWDDAHAKATAALAKLSQDEKIGLVTGVGWQNGPCVGNTKSAASIGYPALCLQGKQLCFMVAEAGSHKIARKGHVRKKKQRYPDPSLLSCPARSSWAI